MNFNFSIVLICFFSVFFFFGCRSAEQYRQEADEVSYRIIEQKQAEALGKTEPFTVQRPSDILRKRLLQIQGLQYSGDASLGSDQLEKIPYWPEEDYPHQVSSDGRQYIVEPNKPLQLSLLDALQVGAQNSFDYQAQKEAVFRSALDLDLERNEFRNLFSSEFSSRYQDVRSTGSRGFENSGSVDWTRRLENGLDISAGIAADVVNLLTLGGASAIGLQADASVSMPLMRGAGRHIVTEPLTQAERNTIYAIFDFERFKRRFAVQIAAEYFSVLRQLDQVQNSLDNYISAIASARRSRRLGQAGRLDQIEVDQAVQRELQAREGWINSVESYKRSVDSFKNTLGLPPDALIELDRTELENVHAYIARFMDMTASSESEKTDVSADAEIDPAPPGYDDAGPYELNEELSVRLALNNRLDLRVRQGQVYDAQREVVIRGDALRAELTLLGQAAYGGGRSLGTVNSRDSQIQFDQGTYSALLTLDLPLERTAERNAYRSSYLALEQAVRDVQDLEDSIKLAIRNDLRDLLESREGIKIQAMSVRVAEKRVRSTQMFFDAGRVQIRDVLDAQDDLLSAQNRLTAAIVAYRVAELNLQRDMGLLEMNENGLWKEFSPKEYQDEHAEQSNP